MRGKVVVVTGGNAGIGLGFARGVAKAGGGRHPAADAQVIDSPIIIVGLPRSGADGRDPRWLRADAHWQRMRQNAIMATMHEHSPDHACGEDELQMPDFTSYQWEWMAEVPAWRDVLDAGYEGVFDPEGVAVDFSAGCEEAQQRRGMGAASALLDDLGIGHGKIGI